MELAFIIGVIGTWLIIALAKGADWLGVSGGHQEESEKEFLDRVWRENKERAKKHLEEIKKQKYENQWKQNTSESAPNFH